MQFHRHKAESDLDQIRTRNSDSSMNTHSIHTSRSDRPCHFNELGSTMPLMRLQLESGFLSLPTHFQLIRQVSGLFQAGICKTGKNKVEQVFCMQSSCKEACIQLLWIVKESHAQIRHKHFLFHSYLFQILFRPETKNMTLTSIGNALHVQFTFSISCCSDVDSKMFQTCFK